mgnify:CR=1 FL=1
MTNVRVPYFLNYLLFNVLQLKLRLITFMTLIRILVGEHLTAYLQLPSLKWQFTFTTKKVTQLGSPSFLFNLQR